MWLLYGLNSTLCKINSQFNYIILSFESLLREIKFDSIVNLNNLRKWMGGIGPFRIATHTRSVPLLFSLLGPFEK